MKRVKDITRMSRNQAYAYLYDLSEKCINDESVEWYDPSNHSIKCGRIHYADVFGLCGEFNRTHMNEIVMYEIGDNSVEGFGLEDESFYFND